MTRIEEALLDPDSPEAKREKMIEEGLELVKKLQEVPRLHPAAANVAHDLEQLFLRQLETLQQEK